MESEGRAPWGLMSGWQLNSHRVLRLFRVLLMVEMVPGARGPFTGAHMSPVFSASDAKQTSMVDVYIQVRSWHQVGVYSSNQQLFIECLLCARY